MGRAGNTQEFKGTEALEKAMAQIRRFLWHVVDETGLPWSLCEELLIHMLAVALARSVVSHEYSTIVESAFLLAA